MDCGGRNLAVAESIFILGLPSSPPASSPTSTLPFSSPYPNNNRPGCGAEVFLKTVKDEKHPKVVSPASSHVSIYGFGYDTDGKFDSEREKIVAFFQIYLKSTRPI